MGLPGPLRGEPMLFLLSLVGDGGAGFPICKTTKEHKSFIHLKTSWVSYQCFHHYSECQWLKYVSVFNVIVHWVHKISYWWTEPPLSKALQSSVKSLVLLYTELSIQAAFIIWASEVMREQRLREIALQTAVQISVTTHEERARQREFDKQKGQSICWWQMTFLIIDFSPLRAPTGEKQPLTSKTFESKAINMQHSILVPAATPLYL